MITLLTVSPTLPKSGQGFDFDARRHDAQVDHAVAHNRPAIMDPTPGHMRERGVSRAEVGKRTPRASDCKWIAISRTR